MTTSTSTVHHRTHLFTHKSGETVEVFYSSDNGHTNIVRTIPGCDNSAWGNWVEDLLWSPRSCVQRLNCWADFYPLVGKMTLEGFTLVEHTPFRGHVAPTANLAAFYA